MKEKIITGRKYGMAVLLGYLALLVAAVLVIVYGAVRGRVFFIALGVLYVSLGWIALCGLRVLKPQEALVLTLFGKYIGTLKGEGFYYVNPFCSAVNPAANTKLSQSGDVDGAKNGIVIAAGQTSSSIEVAGNKKISLKIMTLNNSVRRSTTASATPWRSASRSCGVWWTRRRPSLTLITTRNTFLSSATAHCATSCESTPTTWRRTLIRPATAWRTKGVCAARARS